MTRPPFIPWDTISPDHEHVILFGDHKIIAYDFGFGDNVVLALNGGPGLPCDYLRDSHSFLKDFGFRLVIFDQLGTGRSDAPTDDTLWTIERYTQEVELVRSYLNLNNIHLLGQSWGGWLAIEYACTYPQHIKSLILENTCADIPFLTSELERLRSALGHETVTMMKAHEADGTIQHPEYLAAITLLDYRHVCRLKNRPAPLQRSLSQWNAHIYNVMQGPNEFLYTGNLRNWSRLDALRDFEKPALIFVGQYDEITPACAMQMRNALKNSTLKVFYNSSHSPFFEEPALFQSELVQFLETVPQ